MILLYNNILLYERIKIFFIVLVIILGYLQVIRICKKIINSNFEIRLEEFKKELKMEKLLGFRSKLKENEKVKKDVEEYLKGLEKIIRRLVIIYNYKNPIIY